MKKKNIQLIITLGLIFVFIFIALKDIKILKSKGFIKKEVQKLEEIVLPENLLKEEEIVEKRQGWGRDPFIFGMSVEGVESRYGDLHLNGIVWDAEVPYAVINNEVVKVGDMLGQIRVVEINKDEVILEEEGERFSLRLEGINSPLLVE